MFPAIGDIMAQGAAGVQKNVEKRQQATLANPAQNTGSSTGGTYAANVSKHLDLINQVSQESGVPARVLAALIHIENGALDPQIVRPDTGAAGLMQVVGGPTDPLENIRAGAKLLREKQALWGIDPNNWEHTAAAYFGTYDKGQVTEARDATGTTGPQYVAKYRAAYNLYPDSLQPQYDSSAGGGAGVAGQSAPNTAPIYKNAQGQPTRPTQFDPQLTLAEQYAACGPAAATAFAQHFGVNTTVKQTFDMARSSKLWKGEMQGPESTAQLISNMGVPAKVEPVNWERAVAEVGAGRPIIFDTRGHIYYADGYNPQTGAFHVGTSGTDTQGGAEWMTPDQIVNNSASQGQIRKFITAA
jgi:hypothetical protein